MADVFSTEYTAKPKAEVFNKGIQARTVPFTFAIASGDPALNDEMVIARNLSYGEYILGIELQGGATALVLDAGFRKTENGEVLDADALIDGLASAALTGKDYKGTSISSFNEAGTIGELLGKNDTEMPAYGVDCYLTVKTVASATGTLKGKLIIGSRVSG
jgi:hypothetical protein